MHVCGDRCSSCVVRRPASCERKYSSLCAMYQYTCNTCTTGLCAISAEHIAAHLCSPEADLLAVIGGRARPMCDIVCESRRDQFRVLADNRACGVHLWLGICLCPFRQSVRTHPGLLLLCSFVFGYPAGSHLGVYPGQRYPHQAYQSGTLIACEITAV